MSAKILAAMALDHLGLIQQHLNALEQAGKSISMTPQQRSAFNKRRQAFLDMAKSALDLYKVAKAEFLFSEQREKNKAMERVLAFTSGKSLKERFEAYKILRPHNLHHLVV